MDLSFNLYSGGEFKSIYSIPGRTVEIITIITISFCSGGNDGYRD